MITDHNIGTNFDVKHTYPYSYPSFNRQEQALRDVKAAAEAAQLVLAEDAKRSAEALNAKRSLVQTPDHDTPYHLIKN